MGTPPGVVGRGYGGGFGGGMQLPGSLSQPRIWQHVESRPVR